MNIELSTLQQNVARLIADYGIRDYLQQFYLIHEPETDESDGSASEGAFFRSMMEETDSNQIELGKLFKRTNPMLRETLRLLALIAPLPVDGEPVLPRPTELKAFHESMFLVLYHIRVNLRRMFELAFGCEEDPDGFVEQMQEKYNLNDVEVEALTMDWMDTYEEICQRLLDQSFRLMIFTGGEVYFRLDEADGRTAIAAPPYLMTENQLIISKDYFFIQLLTVLKHIEVMTKITSMEKGLPYDDEMVPVMEMFEMEAVFPIAEALISRKNGSS